MKGLFKNEVIKVFKQTGFKVLMCIILALTILIPVGSFVINKLSSYSSSGRAENSYELYNEWADELENNESTESKISVQYYRAEADAVKFFIDNDIENSWKYQYMYSSYREAFLTERCVRLIADGKYTARQILNSEFDVYLYDALSTYVSGDDDNGNIAVLPSIEDYEYYEYYESSVDNYDDGFNVEDQIDKIDWKKCADYYSDSLAKTRDYILSATSKMIFSSYLESGRETVAECTIALEAARQEAKAAKAKYDGNSENDDARYAYESAEYKVKLAEAELAKANDILWGYQFLYDKECDFDDWQYKAVVNLYMRAVRDRYSEVLRSEYLYEKDKNNIGYDSYEEYKDSVMMIPETGEEAAVILRYSLENDIPVSQALDRSAKSTWKNHISTILGLITTFAIILSGMIVASEHTNGTIRLLLIRPKKRWKILLSKVLCVLFYTMALTLASVIILFFMSMIFNGVSDIFVPDVVFTGEHIIELTPILPVLGICGLMLLTAFLLSSIALFFSVITKRSVLSIALPLIITSVISTVQMMCIMLVNYVGFIKYTILPYADLEVFTSNALDYYASSMSFSISSVLSSTIYPAMSGFSAPYGIFMTVLHIAVIVGFTFFAFNKQQMKN